MKRKLTKQEKLQRGVKYTKTANISIWAINSLLLLILIFSYLLKLLQFKGWERRQEGNRGGEGRQNGEDYAQRNEQQGFSIPSQRLQSEIKETIEIHFVIEKQPSPNRYMENWRLLYTDIKMGNAQHRVYYENDEDYQQELFNICETLVQEGAKRIVLFMPEEFRIDRLGEIGRASCRERV